MAESGLCPSIVPIPMSLQSAGGHERDAAAGWIVIVHPAPGIGDLPLQIRSIRLPAQQVARALGRPD
jgi:hypothetical protein